MLTHDELVTLERSLRGTPVLSVYLEGSAADFASQRTWRVHLDQALDGIRARLASAPRKERELFDASVHRLETLLATPEGLDSRPGARGWVAFVTPERVHYASPARASMPTLAVWDTAACVAPYFHALKENRPVILSVVDARKATIHRYRFGALERVATLHAYHAPQPLAHMGDTPRVGFHSGTRGRAGRDAAQRARLAGRNRMLAELAARMTALAGDDGWILVGGIPGVVAHTVRLLAPVSARVLALDGLDVHASPSRIVNAARAGASALRDAWDARQLDEITTLAEAGTLGALGPDAIDHALELSRVRSLFVSEQFLLQKPTAAADILRRALDQHAAIEEVSRTVAQRLDAHGGVAARLRYRAPAGAEGLASMDGMSP